MKKFRCYSNKKEDYPGFIIEGDFPETTMVCFPLHNIGNLLDGDFFLLVPEKESEKTVK